MAYSKMCNQSAGDFFFRFEVGQDINIAHSGHPNASWREGSVFKPHLFFSFENEYFSFVGKREWKNFLFIRTDQKWKVLLEDFTIEDVQSQTLMYNCIYVHMFVFVFWSAAEIYTTLILICTYTAQLIWYSMHLLVHCTLHCRYS